MRFSHLQILKSDQRFSASAALTSLACLATEMPKCRQSLQSAMTMTMVVTLKKGKVEITDRYKSRKQLLQQEKASRSGKRLSFQRRLYICPVMRAKTPKIRRTRARASRLYAAHSQSEISSRLPVGRPAKEVQVAPQERSHLLRATPLPHSLLRGFSWSRCETTRFHMILLTRKQPHVTADRTSCSELTSRLILLVCVSEWVSECMRVSEVKTAPMPDQQLSLPSWSQKMCVRCAEFNLYFLLVLTRLSLSHHREMKVRPPSAPWKTDIDRQSSSENLGLEFI